MLTWYFFSVPTSVIPSPYFRSVRAMLRHLSRNYITQFRNWQGSHEAPTPVDDFGFHSVQEEEK